MSRKLLLIIALSFTLFSSVASAADMVKWVDAVGRTHFGNAQCAPAGAGVGGGLAAVEGAIAGTRSHSRRI